MPPAPGVKSPALWGTQPRLQELFGGDARSIRVTDRDLVFRYRSPQHWLDVFRSYYGPMNRTYAALGESGQAELTRDLLDMGDTLTHLQSLEDVGRLMRDVAASLRPGGRFVATFRDYRELPV